MRERGRATWTWLTWQALLLWSWWLLGLSLLARALDRLAGGVRWSVDRGFTGAEMAHCPLMAWWGIAIIVTPPEQLRQSALYREMLQVAPSAIWVLVSLLASLSMLAGVVNSRQRLSEAGFIVTAAFWLMVGSLIYMLSHSPLTTSVYVVLAASALWRFADLATDDVP